MLFLPTEVVFKILELALISKYKQYVPSEQASWENSYITTIEVAWMFTEVAHIVPY